MTIVNIYTHPNQIPGYASDHRRRVWGVRPGDMRTPRFLEWGYSTPHFSNTHGIIFVGKSLI